MGRRTSLRYRIRNVRRLDVAAFALGLAAGAWSGVFLDGRAAPEAGTDGRPPAERPVEEVPSLERPAPDTPLHRAV